jgi:soluble lytic murein transglycosylase-like protein
MGVNLGARGVSSIYDYATVDAATREARRKEEEAKQLEKDMLAAQNAGISLEQYRTAKNTERNKELLDMVGSGGSQIVGGGLGALGGAKAGALAGAGLGSFIPVVGTGIGAGIGGLAGALYGGYLGSGTGEVAYQKAKEGIGNLVEPGSVRELTPMELATRFSEAGTAGLVPEAGGAALKAVGKGSARGAQKLADALGPSTKEEALARASGILEPQFPSAKVRGRYAGQVAREQTAGMKTTAEVLGTPEAYMAEQAIGTNLFNQPLYNARIAENAVESQKFLIDDLSKEVAAKSGPDTVSLLKKPEVSNETAGKLMTEAMDDAKERLKKEVALEYAPLDLAERTSTAGVKSGVYDALKDVYGTVPVAGKKGKPSTEKLSKSIPGEIRTFAEEIRNPSFKNYSVEQLQRWQTRARNLIDTYGNDKGAVKALTQIRTVLTEKIKSTQTGAAYWSNATETAKNAWNLMENHKFAKILERDRLNAGDIYKAAIADPENFKAFKGMVGDNAEILNALKAKAIADIKDIVTAAGEDTAVAAAKKAAFIRKNEPWLKELFTPDEFKRLDELALRGEAQAVRSAKTNPLGGSPTAARSVASQSGLQRLIGKGGKPLNEEAQAAAKNTERLKMALLYGGGALGAGYLGNQLGGYGGIPVGMAATILALRKGEMRVGRGQQFLREAAYDIAMNPKTAGWTAPKLAQALAKRRVEQVGRMSRVGEKTGRITGRAGQVGRLVPTQEEKQAAQEVMKNPDAYLAMDELLRQYSPQEEAAPQKPATPKVRSVERVPSEEKKSIENMINTIPKQYGVDPKLVKAIASTESSMNPKAIGPDTRFGNAKGLMQLIDATAKSLKVKDPFDPEQSIVGASKLLKELEGSFGQYKDPRFIMAAYNSNPRTLNRAIARVRKQGKGVTWSNVSEYMPQETQDYVIKVSKLV